MSGLSVPVNMVHWGKTMEWLGKGSAAHEVLSEIILSECWLKEVHMYLHFR